MVKVFIVEVAPDVEVDASGIYNVFQMLDVPIRVFQLNEEDAAEISKDMDAAMMGNSDVKH